MHKWKEGAAVSEAETTLGKLRAISKKSAFNEWLGLEVTAASEGRAELQMTWRSEFGQYSGFLHAGLMGALIDTACGFAAATITPGVLASHYSVNFFRPAVATRFIAQGQILKLGKRQIFCRAEIYGDSVTDKRLLASGETILMVGA
jgi:uncharacterized protein (TIGR00369 family)